MTRVPPRGASYEDMEKRIALLEGQVDSLTCRIAEATVTLRDITRKADEEMKTLLAIKRELERRGHA